MTEQERWEKQLEKLGLGMRAGETNWLVYGHEYEVKPNTPEQISSHYADRKRKRIKPRQIAKAQVWGKPLPEVANPETPLWGYAGGYDGSGNLVTWGPGKERHRKMQEEQLCSKVATHPRKK